MAKYVIDIPDSEETMWEGFNGDLFIPITMNKGTRTWVNTDLKMTPYTEPDRKAIEDEVWEFAWEVLQLDLPVFTEIFGYDTDKMDYRDYKYKYEAWKKKKDQIRVGDEVEICGTVGIVTKVPYLDEERVNYIAKSGTTYCNNSYAEIKKTGRHFDEIEELLKKIGEES